MNIFIVMIFAVIALAVLIIVFAIKEEIVFRSNKKFVKEHGDNIFYNVTYDMKSVHRVENEITCVQNRIKKIIKSFYPRSVALLCDFEIDLLELKKRILKHEISQILKRYKTPNEYLHWLLTHGAERTDLERWQEYFNIATEKEVTEEQMIEVVAKKLAKEYGIT